MPLCQVEIPKDLHRRARFMALKRGITLRQALVDGLHALVAQSVEVAESEEPDGSIPYPNPPRHKWRRSRRRSDD